MMTEDTLREQIRAEVVRVLRTIRDPEIPVNIYDLGLVYAIDIDPSGNVAVRMTLTAPGCPVAHRIVEEVQSKLMDLPIVASSEVELVWEPPWTRDRMTPAAKLQLGL
jgi:FeS assembly SUF system protein